MKARIPVSEHGISVAFEIFTQSGDTPGLLEIYHKEVTTGGPFKTVWKAIESLSLSTCFPSDETL